jgi:hypothetical protein
VPFRAAPHRTVAKFHAAVWMLRRTKTCGELSNRRTSGSWCLNARSPRTSLRNVKKYSPHRNKMATVTGRQNTSAGSPDVGPEGLISAHSRNVCSVDTDQEVLVHSRDGGLR